jgi:APA family basic amino acid/polyamine antiporter
VAVAAGIAGPSVVLGLFLAALVATANGLSSAQLAASHPVSGGTYEYGYRYLTPSLGFTAGWMFLCAKTASAATAALGFSGYLLNACGADSATWLVPAAVATVVALAAIVASGIRRSNLANTLIVLTTLVALATFALAGAPLVRAERFTSFRPGDGPSALLHATALLFVAYTGYGRVATLGEEVRDPARTIPRAIVLTLVVSFVIYAAVGFVGVGAAGADAFAGAARSGAAPLETIARTFPFRGAAWIVAAGAMTAMLGVLLNLLLGLSRVLLAMGRRGDMPRALARIDRKGTTPLPAVVATGAAVAGLALLGDVRTTWSFSAFTVLVYYALTNLAALRLPAAARRHPRWIAVAGLIACTSLAFFVERTVWLAGLGLVAAGLAWHAVAGRLRASRPTA